MTKITLRDGFKSLSNSIITGSLTISGSDTSTNALDIFKSGSDVVRIAGSQGPLLSITDSLSGSVFLVNISGIPVFEVFSDSRVNIGTQNSEAIKVIGSSAIVTGSFTGSLAASNSNSGTNVVTIDPTTGAIYYTGSYTAGGGGSDPLTINNNTNNYILTATGNANEVNGESNLTFDGSTLIVTGEASASAFILNPGTLSISSNTVTWDMSTNGYAELSLTANVTTFNFNNHKKGGSYTLKITQGSGAYNITWGASVKWPTYMNKSITTTNGSIDIVSFISDGTNLYAVKQNDFS